MRHVERRAVIVAADQLNGTYQFFRIWIVEQKGEVLNGLVSQPAAARLLPRQVLIENTNRMSGARKFRAAHCARGSAADDRYVRHLAFSDCVEVRRRVEVLPGVTSRLRCPFPCWRRQTGNQLIGKTTTLKPARSIAPKIAAASADPVLLRTTSMPVRWT